MSHDVVPHDRPAEEKLESVGLPVTHDTTVDQGVALTDANKVLRITLVSIVVFSAIVHLFVF